ncbi:MULTISPECIES: lytic polysaccharide monooxygenase auxiliary activity family 9 protein [unclassified Pseudomonas]|uniref:lytic polysaccharide monooxygenase auxiliary activity family 9 protein n=1 Tax=unclassified Pseudomonas TaxID=196821 RepID=UPI00088104EC|nr:MULTISPECIES: lytic polysaccharide monooxygenase auxiliary activity family 9 protein [unclassified Pseudomonas]UVL57697.1 lytic polysaccharide monooxygenase [Pseudomonas sp. B21-035]SDQ92719.1 chitin-binding protein [Pseudomonas sp. UC 17F4]
MNSPEKILRHGRVITPASRGSTAIELKLLGVSEVNEMEGGKNFPDTVAGPVPAPYQDDVQSTVPPADGYILSGGRQDKRDCVNFTNAEMSAKLGHEFKWPLLNVTPGQNFKVEWTYTAPHLTRGYRWFITKDGWDESKRITRAQLETTPFADDIYPYVPRWAHTDKLVAKVEHEVKLPANKKGHHVIVLLWLVADTGNAFYQAFDVNFQ